MSSDHHTRAEQHLKAFVDKVGNDEERRLLARHQATSKSWSGLTFFGTVGWTIAITTLLGAGLGYWLDQRAPGPRSWSLIGIVAGLLIGCWNAGRWIASEEGRIRESERKPHD